MLGKTREPDFVQITKSRIPNWFQPDGSAWPEKNDLQTWNFQLDAYRIKKTASDGPGQSGLLSV